jgi:histone deacetylase 1/2
MPHHASLVLTLSLCILHFHFDYSAARVPHGHALMFSSYSGAKRSSDTSTLPTSTANRSTTLRIIADSGCTDHLLNISLKYFTELRPIHNTISTAGSSVLSSTFTGNVGPHLLNAQYCKDVTRNLGSISQLCAQQRVVLFTKSNVYSFDERHFSYTGVPVLSGYLHRGLYYLDIPLEEPSIASSADCHSAVLIASALVDNNCTLWHRKLGHLNIAYMNKLKSSGLIPGLSWTADEERRHLQTICAGCALGKMKATPTRRVSRGIKVPRYKIDAPGALIMVDLFFSDIPSLRSRHTVGLMICDCYSRMCWSFSMLHKNDAPAKLKLWLQSMQRLKVNIKHFSVIRSDNGGEFTDIDFQSVLTEFQISHERSPPDAHVQQVERSIGIHKDNARAMVTTNSLNLSRAAMWATSGKNSNPYAFWPQAMSYSCQTASLLFTKAATMTRHHMFFGYAPDVTRFKTFGCLAYALVYSKLRQTWDPTSSECVYMGFNPESPNTWTILKLDTKQFVDCSTCVFNENTIIDDSSDSSQQHVSPFSSKESSSKKQRSIDKVQPAATVWSTRTRSAQALHESLMALLDDDPQQEFPLGSRTLTYSPDPETAYELSPEEEVEIERRSETFLLHSYEQLLELPSSAPSARPTISVSQTSACYSTTTTTPESLPRSYHEAVRYPEWSASVQRELASLEKCNIMEIIEKEDLPEGAKPLDWTYVFKIKTDLNTGAKTYKSRATIRGDRQKPGIDYDETFAPVVRMKTLRTLLALAAIYGWHVHGMDVDTAFLNGEIAAGEKPVFVKIPHGYPLNGKWTHKRRDHLYGRLLKHVYGLKQAPRT